MNETQMRSLVSAVDCGSINAAARELFVTPPSLHQRLGVLEAEMGCRLLERDSRGVRPTEAGARLYKACVECLKTLDEARRDMAAMGSKPRPRKVRIGVDWRPSMQAYYAIERLHDTRPDLDVSAVKVTGKSLMAALRDGDIDLFERTRLLDDDGLAYQSFGHDAYRCVCGPESPWARAELVTLGMLEDATVYAGADYRDYRSYLGCEPVRAFCAHENFRKDFHSTEEIVADCMSNRAVVLFPTTRADELCPPLVHTALDIPPAEIGAYMRPDADEAVLAVAGAIREQVETGDAAPELRTIA